MAPNAIEHRRTQVRCPQTNGFLERFNRTLLDEFFRTTFRERFYDSLETLQADLDGYLKQLQLRALAPRVPGHGASGRSTLYSLPITNQLPSR